MRLPSGSKAKANFEVTNAGTNALSVPCMNRLGNSVVFTPYGGYMTKVVPPRPPDAEDFDVINGMNYLRVEEIHGRAGAGAQGGGRAAVSAAAGSKRSETAELGGPCRCCAF